MSATSGYSGTPLAKKLGMVAGCAVYVRNAPDGYHGWLAPLPEGVQFQGRLSASTDIVHLFCDLKADLAKQLETARAVLKPNGAVWVSWPKKASKVPTDITEDTIRELCLPIGFVDVKVCAVSDVWSGLKLVIRKELR
ncbi:DUF3052 family protein [Pseudoduganella sp. FT55W]|uniref:DUF3052 family protein n=1 Tax=Duganella rivi TaxID=2666083 RepID=A0A7X4GTP2_9BURK|nr:DUF3052 family protein [Duganella rivi]MYM68462.1 DUF3052 family protein [Duganella rivi]